ncbi:hypothetical protein B0F90DRAFT_1792033, partial [Multifurca ochricompacta]
NQLAWLGDGQTYNEKVGKGDHQFFFFCVLLNDMTATGGGEASLFSFFLQLHGIWMKTSWIICLVSVSTCNGCHFPGKLT